MILKRFVMSGLGPIIWDHKYLNSLYNVAKLKFYYNYGIKVFTYINFRWIYLLKIWTLLLHWLSISQSRNLIQIVMKWKLYLFMRKSTSINEFSMVETLKLSYRLIDCGYISTTNKKIWVFFYGAILCRNFVILWLQLAFFRVIVARVK